MNDFEKKIKNQKEKIIEFDFPLTSKLEYAHEGETQVATLVKFTSPTSKNMKHCAILKQAFFRAVADLKNENVDLNEATDSKEIDGDSLIQIMYMSKGVEMASVLVTARELFTSGVAEVDGTVRLTKPLMDLISQDDLEGMLGEYLANFTLLSVLSKMKSK